MSGMASANSATPAAEAATPKACPSCGKRYPADALFCSFDGAPLTTMPGAIAAAAATDVYVGREINGHIEIRQLVGIGAMGRVYRAFQKGIDRDVAVKILHRELSANQTLVTRFHREAKVASRLAHPNVVHVLLTGQLPDGAMYIVMEYLDGMSLQSALGAAGGAMPLQRALHVALQLCDAAGEAHAQGVVHRDLKPENVMLVKRSDDPDYVKVLDFGIARLNWGEQSMATAAGLIFGTARYISPEGAQGEKVGPQGDVYSIATIVYQMLAGRSPFDAEQAVALLVQQIHDPPRSLKAIERAAYVPDPIAAVVMRNLSKRPEDRAENARAFGRMLLEAAVESGLSAQDILARPAMLPGGRGTTPSAVQMPSMQRTHAMPLGPQDSARLAPPPAASTPAGESSRPAKTAYLTPASEAASPYAPAPARDTRTQLRTEIPDVPEIPDLEPPPAAGRRSRSPSLPGVTTTKWHPTPEVEARMAPPPPPSGVDLTMDDQQAHIALPRTSAGTTPPAPVASVAPVPPSVAAPPSSAAPAASQRTAPPASRAGAAPSRPGALDTTLDRAVGDEAADIAAAQPQSRVPIALVVACFVLGAALTAIVAVRGGVGAKAAPRPAPSVPPALEVLNVVPSTPPAPPAPTGIPPLAVDRGQGGQGGAPASGAARAMLDVSSARPMVGQPVDLVGRLPGSHAKVDGPRFHVAGPGLPGADVSAVDDGSGAYRASFTFLQAGRFQVDFLARTDGAPARAVRMLVVTDGQAAPAGPADTLPSAATAAPPPPSPSAAPGPKWM